jgi:hypothetical protein
MEISLRSVEAGALIQIKSDSLKQIARSEPHRSRYRAIYRFEILVPIWLNVVTICDDEVK